MLTGAGAETARVRSLREVRDKDGNLIKDAEVTVDPNNGEITVTVPEGTDPQDATVVIKDADGDQVGEPIDIEITEPAPSIDNGEGKVEVIEPGAKEPTKLDDTVKNPTEDLTGEVRDNDGNPIEGAEVTVDPETGEITVTVPEDAPTGPATVIIKDGDDNVGDPIHVVVAEPTADPTPVDTSGMTEVQPTDDEQSTGIKVDNLDCDTRVQAKDEDGKVIPVIVDEDGEISVVPGTDVDGPITVTVTDPELPGGKAEIEVPVAGHTKGKDDNGSDRTVVPGTKVEEIQQGGEGTLDDKVKNPTGGMTGEVRDNDGNLIEDAKVTVDPETGEITVEVPEDAPTGPATVVVKDKDGNDVGGPIHIVITEKPAETPAPSITGGENPKDEVVADGEPKTIDDKLTNPTDSIPIGLATQTAIPGLSPVVEQYSEQIRLTNARIRQELGVFNPEIALQVEVINTQLRQFGLDVATVGAGLALIAAGILTGMVIYDNCTPGGIGSSVKDLELKGSSGKTYAGSSEKK